MYLKDSLVEEECRVKEKAVQIAKALSINSIILLPQLPTEQSPCCLTELYRFIGELMDGKYRNGFHGIPFRTYCVSTRKYETDCFIL